MSSQLLFYLIIFLLVADFVFERCLAALNIRHSRLPLPAILQGIYAPDRYARQQEYFRTNARFGMWTSSFSFLLTLLMYSLGGFGWLDGVVRSWVQGEMAVSLIFFGIIFSPTTCCLSLLNGTIRSASRSGSAASGPRPASSWPTS